MGKGLKSEEQQMQRAVGENIPGCLRNCKETSVVEQSEGETCLFVSLLSVHHIAQLLARSDIQIFIR